MAELVELLRLSAQSDQQAFQQLYQESSPKLFALARRMMRDEAQAEDVLQEGFVKIWRNAKAYTPDKGSPMTWMSTIIRNQALDKLRQSVSRPVLTEEGEYESLEFASTDISPDDLKALSDDAQRLKNCLDQLQAEQKEAVMAAYYFGYTHPELAERFARPLGTVKAWVRRGLDSLRSCLG